MGAGEIRELSLKDLRSRSEELRTDVFRLRLKMSQEPANALKDWRTTRKELAQVLTVIREKENAHVAK